VHAVKPRVFTGQDVSLSRRAFTASHERLNRRTLAAQYEHLNRHATHSPLGLGLFLLPRKQLAALTRSAAGRLGGKVESGMP